MEQEIDHAKELYDYWMLMVKHQTSAYQLRQWEKYKEAFDDGQIGVDWSYRVRQDTYGLLPQARLHERGVTIQYVGVWNGEPILGFGYKAKAYGYYSTLDLRFVLYPDGDFVIKTHFRPDVRQVCRHTFLGSFRFKNADHVHFNPCPAYRSGVSWVNFRDWQTRKMYFRLTHVSTDVLYRIIDGVIQVSPDQKDLPDRLGEYDNSIREEQLAAEYAHAERRYRLHHRKWAKARGESDPYAVLSPRRAKNLLVIQQMVQPYTPARSILLKAIPEQVTKAQEG